VSSSTNPHAAVRGPLPPCTTPAPVNLPCRSYPILAHLHAYIGAPMPEHRAQPCFAGIDSPAMLTEVQACSSQPAAGATASWMPSSASSMLTAASKRTWWSQNGDLTTIHRHDGVRLAFALRSQHKAGKNIGCLTASTRNSATGSRQQALARFPQRVAEVEVAKAAASTTCSAPSRPC